MGSPDLPARFERERLLDEIKDRIRPDGSLEEKAYAIRDEIQAALEATHPGAVVVLGGSVAKGTYLRDNHDVDFFVRFPAGSASGLVAEMLEESLAIVAKKLHVRLERLHGSRDYFQFRIHDAQGTGGMNEVTFEVVPVIHITSAYDAQHVTDAHPVVGRLRGLRLETQRRVTGRVVAPDRPDLESRVVHGSPQSTTRLAVLASFYNEARGARLSRTSRRISPPAPGSASARSARRARATARSRSRRRWG